MGECFPANVMLIVSQVSCNLHWYSIYWHQYLFLWGNITICNLFSPLPEAICVWFSVQLEFRHIDFVVEVERWTGNLWTKHLYSKSHSWALGRLAFCDFSSLNISWTLLHVYGHLLISNRNLHLKMGMTLRTSISKPCLYAEIWIAAM